jgi:HEAT repeat protein
VTTVFVSLFDRERESFSEMNTFSNDELKYFQSAIVSVESETGNGTAFFVLPGLLLSCLHVVEGETDVRLNWKDQRLTVKRLIRPEDWNIDLVGIEVVETDHPLLPLGLTEVATGSVVSFGFQLHDRGYEGYPVWGKHGGRAYERIGAELYDRILILDANIHPGLSGAPLLSIPERKVIGVVKRDNPDGGGYAVPIEYAQKLRSSLLKDNSDKTGQLSCLGDQRFKYLEQVRSEHSFVHLPFASRALRLEDVYTSLSLSSESVTGRKLTLDTSGHLATTALGTRSKLSARRDLGSPHRQYIEPEVKLQELVSQPKAIVLGDPGSGKTTLFRHLTLRACRGEIFPKSIPVFLKANELRDEPGCVARYLAESYQSFTDLLHRSLSIGSVILFLDGLDEVPSEHQVSLERELSRIAAMKNQVFISCRRVAFPRGLFGTDFKIFECVGFNRAQQRRFIQSWFNEKPSFASQIDKDARLNGELAAFLQNPLLLSLMCVVLENSESQTLPSRRIDLYSEAIEVLLSKRRGLKAVPKIDRSTIIRCLRRLAYGLFLSRQEVFDNRQIEKVINAESTLAGHAPDDITITLLDHAGLLTSFGSRSYRFLHLTFQEYLAAEFIVGQQDPCSLLIQHFADPRWEEVIRLSAAMLEPTPGEALLKAIWYEDGEPHPERVSLAGRCASDVRNVSASYVASLVRRLLTVMYESDVIAYSDGAVVALAALCSRNSDAIDGVVSDFREKASEGLSSWVLMKYIQLLELIGSHEAFRELRQLFDHFSKELKEDRNETLIQVIGALGSAIGQTEAADGWMYQLILLQSGISYLEGIAAQTLDHTQPEGARGPLEELLRRPNANQPLIAYILTRYDDPTLVGNLLERAFVAAPSMMGQAALRAAIWSESLNINPALVADLFSRCSGGRTQSCLLEVVPLFLRMTDLDWVNKLIANNDLPLGVRASAINLLVMLRPTQTIHLIDLLFKDSVQVELQRVIISSLSQTGSSDGLEHIFRLVQDSYDERVASSLLNSLNAMPVAGAQPWLRHVIRTSSNRDIRLKALLALSATQSPDTLDFIAEYLGRSSPARERIAVYKALGFLESEAAVRVLLARLREESEIQVVTQVIESLGSRKLVSAEVQLIKLLDLKNWPSNWPRPLPALRKGEQRPSDRRRLAIIISLDKLGSTSAIPSLRLIASDAGESAEVRDAAHTALRNITWLQGTAAL